MRTGDALLVVPVLSAMLAYGFTPLASRLSFLIGAVDHPDARKVHACPTPRLGGVAVILAVVVVLTLASAVHGWTGAVPDVLVPALGLGLLPIVAISVLDDIRPRPAAAKFLCHLGGAIIAVAAGISLPETIHVLGAELVIGPWAAPISVVWLTGVTNAFNIIDGLDGLAAGLSFISAIAVSAVLLTSGDPSAAILPLALAGSLAGFLPFNFYPARIFLGDTGATAIGFTLAVMSLKGGVAMSAGFATAMPLLILGLPIADTAVSIVRRLCRSAEHRVGGVFQPDRDHVHHRLLALGLHHRQAVLVLHAVGGVTAVVAYLSMFISHRESALLLLGLLLAGAIGLKRLGYDEFALLRRGTILRLYEAPVLRRTMFVAFADIAFVCASVYLAVGLKTDDWRLHSARDVVLQLAALLAPLTVIVFLKVKMYERSWRLASVDDYVRASAACGLVVGIAWVLCVWRLPDIPTSLLIVYGLVNSLLVVGSRASYRVLVSAQRSPRPAGTPAILYGPEPDDYAGARDLIERAGSLGLRPVGFITSTGDGRGRSLAGLNICGGLDELPLVARSRLAHVAVLARRSSPALTRRFEALCLEGQVRPYRLNTELEAIAGEPGAQPLRDHDEPRLGWARAGERDEPVMRTNA